MRKCWQDKRKSQFYLRFWLAAVVDGVAWLNSARVFGNCEHWKNSRSRNWNNKLVERLVMGPTKIADFCSIKFEIWIPNKNHKEKVQDRKKIRKEKRAFFWVKSISLNCKKIVCACNLRRKNNTTKLIFSSIKRIIWLKNVWSIFFLYRKFVFNGLIAICWIHFEQHT